MHVDTVKQDPNHEQLISIVPTIIPGFNQINNATLKHKLDNVDVLLLFIHQLLLLSVPKLAEVGKLGMQPGVD